METAIGVFSSRDRAEEAVRELLDQKVPKDSIVFLTRSETEAKSVGKGFGATVGGFMGAATGMSAGVVAASLLVVPGIGQVFALGFGAAALLGLAGAGAGSAIGGAAAGNSASPRPTPDEKSSEDAALFRELLKEDHSLIVVRTESHDTATVACGILDRLGLGTQGHTPIKMQTAVRQVAGVAIVDVSGRITLGEGNVILRDTVRGLLEKGSNKILLNLHEVGYVDSSGIGELVKSYATVRSHGGHLKLVNPSKRVHDLLQLTKLYTVFDIQADEASAIQSF
ncbi:MAG: STAS domain-containing protein [Terriglobales bacterium]